MESQGCHWWLPVNLRLWVSGPFVVLPPQPVPAPSQPSDQFNMMMFHDSERRGSWRGVSTSFGVLWLGKSTARIQYFARGANLRSKLAASGVEVSEDELVAALLAGLPAEYETADTILTTGQGPLSIDESMKQLMAVKNRLNNNNGSKDDAAALVAKKKGYQAHGREERKCHYCGKKGHNKRNCFKLKRESGQQSENRIALTAAASTSVDMKKDSEDSGDTLWVLDSGASYPMAADKTSFKTFRPQTDVTVELGDGNIVRSQGVGDVVVTMVTEAGRHDLTLKTVLHAPVFNLISIPQMTKRGAKVVFKGSHG